MIPTIFEIWLIPHSSNKVRRLSKKWLYAVFFLILTWGILLASLFVLGAAEIKRQKELAEMDRKVMEIKKQLAYTQAQRRALVIWLNKTLKGEGVNTPEWQTINSPVGQASRLLGYQVGQASRLSYSPTFPPNSHPALSNASFVHFLQQGSR